MNFSQSVIVSAKEILLSRFSDLLDTGMRFITMLVRGSLYKAIKPIINCCKHSKMIEAFFYGITDQGYIHMTVMIAAINSR